MGKGKKWIKEKLNETNSHKDACQLRIDALERQLRDEGKQMQELREMTAELRSALKALKA